MSGANMALTARGLIRWHKCCGTTLEQGHNPGCKMVVGEALDTTRLGEMLCRTCGYHVCSCVPSAISLLTFESAPATSGTVEAPSEKRAFKKGDRVRCVRGCSGLTEGKEYVVMIEPAVPEMVVVRGDGGTAGLSFYAERFVLADEQAPDDAKPYPSFGKGDRLRCVYGTDGLTEGKDYSVLDTVGVGPYVVVVRGDNGKLGEYFAYRFILAPMRWAIAGGER